jgi:SAM-dependent methyltransferase
MHKTAMKHGALFFETYVRADMRIVDIGAQDVNGSLRNVAPSGAAYTGVDFVAGRGVDVVITDPYSLPFETGSVDVVASSSCFEHSEFFWLTFLECLRIVAPEGLLYVNVPSNGLYHRYPVDCWRFYPDSGVALQNWARRNGTDALLLESFIGPQGSGLWNDFVGVFVKDAAHAGRYPARIQDGYVEATNGRLAGTDAICNHQDWPEDGRKLPVRAIRKLRALAGHEPD